MVLQNVADMPSADNQAVKTTGWYRLESNATFFIQIHRSKEARPSQFGLVFEPLIGDQFYNPAGDTKHTMQFIDPNGGYQVIEPIETEKYWMFWMDVYLEQGEMISAFNTNSTTFTGRIGYLGKHRPHSGRKSLQFSLVEI